MEKTEYLFNFIRYIQPTWYFNLRNKSKHAYWVNYNLLEDEDKALIHYDDHYTSNYASLLDASYQAWHKGIVILASEKKLDIERNVSIKDEYRFIKKYYSPIWSLFILFIRLCSFKNPFIEIAGFAASVKTKKANVYCQVKSRDDEVLQSMGLIEKEPLVSVIIPTLNRYKYLKDVLSDLEKQDYKNIEVLVCDQSEPLDIDFYSGWNLKLELIQQEEKALWLARNRCIEKSKGEYLLFYDDDSRVDQYWVSNHLKCIDFFNVKISSGVSLSIIGGEIPTNYAFFRWSDQIDTGNVMLHKSVLLQTGMFDRQFEKMRMGDGEFGARCFKNGIANISNPLASRVHLKVGTGGLRHMGAWDAFRGKNLFSPLPIPSVLYFHRRYFGNKVALFNVIKTLPISVMPYKYKKSKVLSLLGLCVFVLLLPKYLYQVCKSWRKSSFMIKQGPKIEKFEV